MTFAAAGRLRLVEQHTDTQGRLDVAALAALVPDLAERETWACGPAGLLDAIEEQWADSEPDLLHTERFRTALVEPGEGGTVRFTGTGTVLELDGATPILDAGEQSGVLMPSGCRMGICFSCVLPLREGVGPRPALRRRHHRRPGRRRTHPDLHLGRGRHLRHRPLRKRLTMTVLQKKTDNPIGHLSPTTSRRSAAGWTRSGPT